MIDDRERRDGRAALAALCSAAIMIAQQVGSKATRDALFLSHFQATDLPRIVIAAAAASMVTVLLTTRAYARWGPSRVVPIAFAISGALYGIEFSLAHTNPRGVAIALYLHTAVFGALVVSGFWSVVNERFDPHAAKKVISRIGTGATAGGVAGGLIAERVGEWATPEVMLAALAGLNLVAAVGVTQIGAIASPRHVEQPTESAMGVLRSSRYLKGLALLVVLTAITAALLDYAFKAQAQETLRGGDELLRFFAIFHVGAALVSFILQTTLARHALERLGVAGSVATLPTIVLITASIGALIPRMATVVLARATELVLANSIFRSGYELLYTPVPPTRKRPTKALIDVAGNRGGDALGSGIILLILSIGQEVPVTLVLGLGACTAAASLLVARRLHHGYVRQLERMLRDGSSSEAEQQMLKAATLQTLSTLGLDREALFEQLAAQGTWSERASLTSLGEHSERLHSSPDRSVDAPDDDPIHGSAAILRSGDARQIRALLDTGPADPRLAGHLIALLARRDIYPKAVETLRAIGPEVESTLLTALNDPEQPFAIRRRLPRVLQTLVTRECAEALDRGLEDERFEVRYRCAIALARICVKDPSLAPSQERVNEAVMAELARTTRKVWARRRLLDEDTEDDGTLVPREYRDSMHRSVEYLFTVLSLGYESEPLRLAFVALGGEDSTLRGTALEYLENVLPEEMRGSLFPMLDVHVELEAAHSQGNEARARRVPRRRQELVRELSLSLPSLAQPRLPNDRGESPPE